MGCLKSLFKFLIVISLGCLVLFIVVNTYLAKNESQSIVYNISNEMYSDTEKLLNIIDVEFQSFNSSAYIDEDQINKVLDSIEDYGSRYTDTSNQTAEENQMFQDIGLVVYNYLQLIGLDASTEVSQLDFNELFNDYSGQKRDIYEVYLHHRKDLKDKYGFKVDS